MTRASRRLDERVATAEPRALLPPLRAGEEAALALPLHLVDALPLGRGWATLVGDAAGAFIAGPLVDDAGVVRRAAAGDGAAREVLSLLSAGRARPPGFAVVPLAEAVDVGTADERPVGVDQTHDSVVVGERAVVKWAVHAPPPVLQPPAVAALRHLSAVGFEETPEPLGFLLAERPEGHVVLAMADRFLPGATDGWSWYVDDLRRHVEGRSSRDRALAPAADVGALVGRLHLAFATPWAEVPDPVRWSGADDAARWHAGAVATLEAALRMTPGEAGVRLRRRAPAAAETLSSLSEIATTPLTRGHGDLHVGQVLRWAGGYAVSDFDGNPVLAQEERAAPAPPARDVAGMLRSIDHVGRVVDRQTAYAHRSAVARWVREARQAFVDAYVAVLSGAGRRELLDDRLLRPFEVEQLCREYVYAARHLSRWTYVPDTALADLLPTTEEAAR